MKLEPEARHKISTPLSKKKKKRNDAKILIEDPTFDSFTFFEPFALLKQKTELGKLFFSIMMMVTKNIKTLNTTTLN